MATASNISLEMLQDEVTSMRQGMDTFALLVFGSMVLLMQCGFAFLEAGSVRSKNTSNILIKNLLDSFVAGLTYWTIGYALAYGEGNSFIGWTKWVSAGVGDLELAQWYFQFVFAATAATIVSGALAERCEFVAYLIYSFGITGIIYPIVTHWLWSADGWLAQGDDYVIDGKQVNIRYQDFAGSGPVHVLGGVCAFFGAMTIGPRIGRFHSATGHMVPLRGHSVPFAALGGFILIFGFMAFNGGSQLQFSTVEDGEAVALAVANTVLSGSAAAFVSLIGHKIITGQHTWSLLQTINGSLAGMAAICAGCNVVRPWGAFCIGAVAGVTYRGTSELVGKMKIDDPLDAVAVHFGGGAWGVISVAFFHWDEGILVAGSEKSGYFLAWQLIGLTSIIAWTGSLSGLMFLSMRIAGILRVSPELEKKGLDIQKHGEPAYPLESYGHGHVESIETVLDNGELCKVEHGFLDGEPVPTINCSFESPEVISMKRSNSNASINRMMKSQSTANLSDNNDATSTSNLYKSTSSYNGIDNLAIPSITVAKAPQETSQDNTTTTTTTTIIPATAESERESKSKNGTPVAKFQL